MREPLHDGDASGGRFTEPSPADLAIGQIEWDLSERIHELRLIHGFEAMREMVARMINREAEGRPNRG